MDRAISTEGREFGEAIEVAVCDLKNGAMTTGSPLARMTPAIYRVHGVPVMLDADLAAALGMETKRFNEAIKRHADLIDDRHHLQLTKAEFDALRSQSATSNSG